MARLTVALGDRYVIERELGRGGMATVYRARDLRHRRSVALKVLRPELAASLGADRFLREIELSAGLQHPHILPLFDSGDASGLLYYVMPYVAGESLRDRLRRDGRLPVDEALRIAGEAADALDYAHRHGVVHRDIKPENVLLDETGHALVADFGIARAIRTATEPVVPGGSVDTLTQTGLAVGTPAYMSPEQAVGDREVDGRSDIYALGCVVYEMLAGERPFRGTAGDAAIRRIGVSVRTGRPRGVPEELHSQLEAVPLLAVNMVNFSMARDGRRMVYSRGRRFSNLWFVESARTGMQPRMTALTTGTALRWSPTVSPDGRWLAFAQETHDGAELFRMPVDGGAPVQITVGARVWPQLPIAWSPDGRQLAFASIRAGRPRVWVARVDDGRLRSFTRSRILVFGGLAWAPGSHLAYRRPDSRNISLLDPSSGTERSLYPDTAPGFPFGPEYSPDGRRLAVWWNRGPGDIGIWVFDLQDSSYVNVAPGEGGWPLGWSRDGRFLYTGGPPVYRIDTQRRRAPEQVLTVPWRGADCTLAGPKHPNAFVCAATDFVSDIWMIENFDAAAP